MSQLQKDSKPVLQHGTGTPYLAIFNPQLSPIRDPKNGLPLGVFVTSFKYIYEEAKSDSGTIDIETDNPDLVAHNELGYQQWLCLQWGYIYPDGSCYVGPLRKVVIIGMKAGFTATGTKITINFQDAAVFLKNQPPEYRDNTKGFINYVEDLCNGVPIGIAIVDYKKKASIKPKVAHRIVDTGQVQKKFPNNYETGTKAEWATGSRFNAIDAMEVVQDPSISIPDAVGVELLDWNPITQRLTVADPDNFRKVYLDDPDLAGAMIIATSRSKYYQIGDIARSMSGGPWFVDSRDDGIVIHNTKSQREVTKVYTYAGGNGELIEFTVNSKYTKSSAEVKQTNELNPDTKNLDTTLVQDVVDPDQGNEDGVDMYMFWPNRGTQFWNPDGGTVAPDRAAYQPLYGSQPGQGQNKPRHLVEYHQENQTIQNQVTGEKELVKTYKSYFATANEARRWLRAHPQVQQSEIDAWFRDWQNSFEEKRNKSDLATIATDLDKIPPFKITRKVTIVREINLEHLGAYHGLTNASVTSGQTEAFRNAVTSGQVDLSAYASDTYSNTNQSGKGGYTGDNSMIMRGTYMKNALKLLESSGFTVGNVTRREGETDQQFKHRSTENRIVSITFDMEIQLNGIDVAAGADTINIPSTLGNDLTEKVIAATTAEATVVGDPIIESSMNIQIQNVSSKYSGLWYTKKVTHDITPGGGYLTKIEFVQRSVPISQVVIRSKLSKKDYQKELIEAFKVAKESGSYKIPSSIVKHTKQLLEESPNQSVVTQVNPKTGEIVDARLDMASGNYVTDYNNNKTYYNGHISPYLQDLQKRVDKLPQE